MSELIDDLKSAYAEYMDCFRVTDRATEKHLRGEMPKADWEYFRAYLAQATKQFAARLDVDTYMAHFVPWVPSRENLALLAHHPSWATSRPLISLLANRLSGQEYQVASLPSPYAWAILSAQKDPFAGKLLVKLAEYKVFQAPPTRAQLGALLLSSSPAVRQYAIKQINPTPSLSR